MKDLSNYILSILDDNIKLGVDVKVQYDEGIYLIKMYVKDVRLTNSIIQKHIKIAADEVLETYFPKRSIQYKINIFYYLA
jgi:hypothetical protein